MLKLALRNVARHRLRTAMTLAAIVFGVIGVVLSGGFVEDVYHKLGEALIHSQSGHLQVARAGFHAQGTRSPEKYVIGDPDVIKQKLLAHRQVADAMARISFFGLLNNGRTDWPVIGEGIEPDKESELGSLLTISAGRQLSDKDVDGVLIGVGVAQALKLAPGDDVTLLASTLQGAQNTVDLKVIGVFQSFSKDYDDRAVKIPLRAAQQLLATDGANLVVVSLKKTSDTGAVAALLANELRAEGLDVKTWIELNDFYERTVQLYRRQFGVLLAIVFIMVILSVANSVYITVFERIGEFGTMRSLGDRPRHVYRLVVLESVLLGLIGSTLGVVGGISLALAISAIGIPMPPPPNANIGYTAEIQIVPLTILAAFGLGVAATTLAALWPAAKVTRIPLVDALRANI
jgi:putative ABC transport system permease protein